MKIKAARDIVYLVKELEKHESILGSLESRGILINIRLTCHGRVSNEMGHLKRSNIRAILIKETKAEIEDIKKRIEAK